MVPLAGLPEWMAAIGHFLPLTHSIEALRTTLVAGDGLTLAGDGGLAWLAATSLGWLIAGAVAFQLGDTAARRTGTLNRH